MRQDGFDVESLPSKTDERDQAVAVLRDIKNGPVADEIRTGKRRLNIRTRFPTCAAYHPPPMSQRCGGIGMLFDKLPDRFLADDSQCLMLPKR